jgi:hypothetical protein
VYEHTCVLSEDDDATGRIMRVRGLPDAITRLRRTLAVHELGCRPVDYGYGPRQKSPVLGRRNDTGGRRSGSPTARHEQKMGGAIHQFRARGIRLLEPLKFIGKLAIT